VRVGAASQSPERRRQQEVARRDRVRREVTRGLRDDVIGAITDLMYKGSPGRLTSREAAVAHVTFQTALAVAGMWEERRPLRDGEAATFRMLGGLAARSGVTEAEALAGMDAGWELVLSRVRLATKGGMWSRRTGASTARGFEGEARQIADTAANELRVGLEAEAQFASDQAFVVQRILDGTLKERELGAAASAAGLDASRPHGIALLVSPVGRSGDVDAAATEAREAVPHILDLGPGDALPPHHRMVVPQITPAQWMETRTALHTIAQRHHVLVVAPVAAPTLASLRASHEQTEHGLGWVLAACGYHSGIIDPACVTPTADAKAPAAEPVLPDAA
jgi:hypothetical protein